MAPEKAGRCQPVALNRTLGKKIEASTLVNTGRKKKGRRRKKSRRKERRQFGLWRKISRRGMPSKETSFLEDSCLAAFFMASEVYLNPVTPQECLSLEDHNRLRTSRAFGRARYLSIPEAGGPEQMEPASDLGADY